MLACLIAQYLDPCFAVVFDCVRQVKSEVATLTARVESLAADASASEGVNAAIQEGVGALQACDWLLNWMASSLPFCVRQCSVSLSVHHYRAPSHLLPPFPITAATGGGVVVGGAAKGV